MSTPLTATQQLAAFDEWDITYHTHPGWENHRRDPDHGSWGPVYGCVTHHTADDAADDLDFKVCWNGRSDLPGPLVQYGLRDDGSLDLIGNGRCNHAGGGDPQVLQAVMNESYGDYPPPTQEHEGSSGAVDFNTHFYGVEIYYSGGHKMTDKQYATLVKLWAAICTKHGWSAKSVIGHKELSDWKIDPGFVDMKVLRKDIQDAIDAGPSGHQVPPPPDQKFPELYDIQLLLMKARRLLIVQIQKHPNMNELSNDLERIGATIRHLDALTSP